MDHSATPPNGSGASSAAAPTHHVPNLAAISTQPQVPERSPSRSSTRHAASHRQSFAENLRNPPPSPRSLRVPSLTQQAIQDLLNHPPPTRQPHPRFAGRDWQDITLGELVLEGDVSWAEMDTSVEDCTKILLKNTETRVVLLRETASDQTAVATFDDSDLNAYLLVAVGLAKAEPEDVAVYRSISQRAQQHQAVSIRDIQPICHKDPIATLPLTQKLPRAIELFGSGVHRILVTNPAQEVVGIVSQLRVLEFFWNEGVNFPVIDRLYPATLRELRVGSQETISINADHPLSEALMLMNNMGLTSVAVVDNGQNVVGNISTTDVEHLTSVTSFPLLRSSCMHFISIILSERGVEEGRDSFPVFHVSAHSTLAHTVAKLVATRSHRMWVVDTASPSPSAPHTPQLAPVSSGSVSSISLVSSSSRGNTAVEAGGNGGNNSGNTHSNRNSAVFLPEPHSVPQSPVPLPQGSSAHSFSSVPAAAMPGAHLSGKLSGVVSLTDVLNLFARTSGLRPSDLADVRARRRRSSSSSLRPSIDGPRTSFDLRR